MAKNFVKIGLIIKFNNTSSEAVVSGQPLVIGDLVGVALLDIPTGESGSVQLDGVWRLPKPDNLALSQGETAYLNAEGLITNVATDSVKAGYVFVDAEQTDTEVEVLLRR